MIGAGNNSASGFRYSNSTSALVHTRSKGQWFIVSAVMVTGVFLVISGLFKSYSLIDVSSTARPNEDFYFYNIKDQFNSVVQGSDCASMDKNLREYQAFAEREVNNLGYRFFMSYTINDCAAKSVSLGLLIGSNNLVVYENVNPDDILK